MQYVQFKVVYMGIGNISKNFNCVGQAKMDSLKTRGINMNYRWKVWEFIKEGLDDSHCILNRILRRSISVMQSTDCTYTFPLLFEKQKISLHFSAQNAYILLCISNNT